MEAKEFKPNKGWLKIMELKRAQAESRVIRLKKEEAYRHMVGSGRELKRKLQEVRRLKAAGQFPIEEWSDLDAVRIV